MRKRKGKNQRMNGKYTCILALAVAQAVSRRPLTAAARVNLVGFVVNKVALGQVFLRVLRFFPVNIIPPWALLFRKLKKINSFSSGDEQ
jgi:hypothetical protein